MAGRDINTLKGLFEENRREDDPDVRKLARKNRREDDTNVQKLAGKDRMEDDPDGLELPRLNLPSMSISISEFATLLNEFQGNNTDGSQSSDQVLDEKTVRNYIHKILSDCGMSLREDQENFGAFQSKYGPSNFMIGPEFQGLFMTLCDSQYAAGRSIDSSIEGRSEYYEKLLSNIQKYLSHDAQNFLRGRMEYRNACTFVEYCTKANKQFSQMQYILLHCNPAAEGLLAQKFGQHMQQCFNEFSEIMKETSKETEIPVYVQVAEEETTVSLPASMSDKMKLPDLLIACIKSLAHGGKIELNSDPFINYALLGRDIDEGEVFKKFEVIAEKEKQTEDKS